MRCRICREHNSIESFEHTIECSELMKFVQPTQLKFEYIYGNEEEKLEFIEAFMKIHKVRDTMIEIGN